MSDKCFWPIRDNISLVLPSCDSMNKVVGRESLRNMLPTLTTGVGISYRFIPVHERQMGPALRLCALLECLGVGITECALSSSFSNVHGS